jgi:hypothetical protein
VSIAHRLRRRRGERPAFVALSVLTVSVLVGWPAVDALLREIGLALPFGFNDYGAYSGALHRWRTGEAIYVRSEAGGYHGSYLYPPITLLLFVPFATVGFEAGAILFGVVSLVLCWTALAAVARVLGCDLAVEERLVLLVALFGFQPALRDFKWGQLSTLLTALLCFAFYAQERGARAVGAGRSARVARFLSGGLTTLASSAKLFVATAGAHLLRDRDRLAGALGLAVAMVVVSLALFGVEAHRSYLDVLLWGKGWGDHRPTYLWDTSAAYRPLAVLGGVGVAVRAVGVLGVVALTLATRGVERADVRRSTFALGVACVPLFAPRADLHDLVVLLLPAVILLAGELDRPGGVPSLPVLSVLFLHVHRYVLELAVAPPAWLPLAGAVRAHAAWLQPAAWATVLLAGLAAYRIVGDARRDARPEVRGVDPDVDRDP